MESLKKKKNGQISLTVSNNMQHKKVLIKRILELEKWNKTITKTKSREANYCTF